MHIPEHLHEANDFDLFKKLKAIIAQELSLIHI
mgnify:CR=1 FL=1